MKLESVVVAHFQRIKSLKLAFGPGLNVLYGPNDIGKTSLASAIRAALLIQHKSAAGKQFAGWTHTDIPTVTVSFSINDDHWRVTKRFDADNGLSTLEYSKDGLRYSVDARGRDVDGRVRRLLSWGIKEPGGKSGKSAPTSFLAQVLLAGQSDVPNILAQSLGDDATESGKERLGDALNALAEDPVFKQVLNQAQAQTDTAYTAKGRRSTKKDSPFRLVNDCIKELSKDARLMEEKVAQSETIELRLNALKEEHAALLSDEAKVAQAFTLRSAQRKQQAQIEQAEQALGGAQDHLKLQVAQFARADKSAHRIQDIGRQIVTSKSKCDARATLKRTAERNLKLAQSRVEQQTGDDSAQKRVAQAADLKSRISAADLTISNIEGRLKALTTWIDLRKSHDKISERHDALIKDKATLKDTIAEIEQTISQANGQRERVRVLQNWAKWQVENARVAQLEAEHEAATKAFSDSAAASAKALALMAPYDHMTLPADDVLVALKAHARQLDIAQAQLETGLALTLTPADKLHIETVIDGSDGVPASITQTWRTTAKRSLSLHIEDVGDMHIEAGDASAIAAHQALLDAWSAQYRPVLRAANVSQPTELEALCKDKDQAAGKAAEAQRLAAQHLENAHAAQARAAGLHAAKEKRASLEQYLLGLTAEEAHYELQQRAPEPATKLETEQLEIDDKRADLNRAKSEANAQQAALKERCIAAKTDLEKTVLALQHQDSHHAHENPAQQLLVKQQEMDRLKQEREDWRVALAAMASSENQALAQAKAALEAAIAPYETADAAHQASENAHRKLEDDHISATATYATLKTDLDALDRPAAEAAVEKRKVALADLPKPEFAVTETDIIDAQTRKDAVARQMKALESDLSSVRGQLTQVGGAVCREDKKTIEEALLRAKEREGDLEIDYEAWRLLRDTLIETQKLEGNHIGKSLSVPVSARFQGLTDLRYGALALDGALKADGIEAGGGLRNIGLLSSGTQDQLATILRMCIAEELNCCLVLDDHLAQTDSHRTKWFKKQLRKMAVDTQVIILTCRPQDYLALDDLPADGQVMVDRAGGVVRVVDMALAIS